MSVLTKIETGTAVVGVVGLGYVGIPLALTVAEHGLPVLGFDVDPERIDDLNAGRSPLRHVAPARIAAKASVGVKIPA